MWKPLIRCSIIGGIVVFLWLMVSWMVLPMHKTVINKFAEPSEVSSTIMRYAPQDGVYVIPSMEEGATAKEDQPFILVNIRRGVNFKDMTRSIITGVITQMIAAFFITYLLLQAKSMKYWNRVWFVTLIGLIVGILSMIPNWNWWHFPTAWTILGIFDLVVGWFLGGLVIAKLIKK